jgi:GT2 family glycosyltransferase
MKPYVTVVLPVYDSERYIRTSIESLLAQTIKNFEIVVVEDPPYDGTKRIIETFADKRIVYLRNQRRTGISGSRNKCIGLARGEYLFFTDDDCIVSANWVEQGLRSFLEFGCVGVEGKTLYVSEEYKPTYSDRVIENKRGGEFMTCNMAYKKSVIQRIGGFDERYTFLEDRDLALRVIKLGKIHFDPEMIVYHQKSVLGPREFLQRGKLVRNWVLIYKRFGEKKYLLWRIVHPLNLVAIIFPPLILGNLFIRRFRTKKDLVLLAFVYKRLMLERLSLWDMCARERVFLI